MTGNKRLIAAMLTRTSTEGITVQRIICESGQMTPSFGGFGSFKNTDLDDHRQDHSREAISQCQKFPLCINVFIYLSCFIFMFIRCFQNAGLDDVRGDHARHEHMPIRQRTASVWASGFVAKMQTCTISVSDNSHEKRN